MMMLLSGRKHQVMTSVVLLDKKQENLLCCVSISEVTFRTVNPDEIKHYRLSGEPMDKAGGYAIQGLGALFVEYLQGSFSAVMGLPLYETAGLLEEAGFRLLR